VDRSHFCINYDTEDAHSLEAEAVSAIAIPSCDLLTARDRRVHSTPGAAARESTLTGGIVSLREIRFPFDGGEFVVQTEGDPPSWVTPTVDALGRLLSMPRGWDSYGARPVNPACITSALEVAPVMHDQTPLPVIVPTSLGRSVEGTHGNRLEIEISSLLVSRRFGSAHEHAWRPSNSLIS
jgi:hypothetical protein